MCDHYTVNFSAGEYAWGGPSPANLVQSVWKLLKRQITENHYCPKGKPLSRYVDEMSWRYNLRDMAEGSYANKLISNASGRLTYRALIA